MAASVQYLPPPSHGSIHSVHCQLPPVAEETSEPILTSHYLASKGGALSYHFHNILFENDNIIVDGKAHGKVSDPKNQSFLESLEKYGVPDEFPGGRYMISVKKIGKTGPDKFDPKYFEVMEDTDVSYNDYDDFNDPDPDEFHDDPIDPRQTL